MAENPVKAVWVDDADPAKGNIRDYMMLRTILVLTSASEIQSTNLDKTTAVTVDGRVFDYDPADSITAHDGITTLVDSTGRRYKTPDALATQARLFKVLDKDLTTPPGSPTAGDTYIVGTGSTGAWATHDGKVAVFSSGIWNFITPIAGDLAAMIDEAKYYHRNVGNTAWLLGIPGSIAAGEITLANLLMGITITVEGVANAPAGGESDGAVYIIGATPSGDFAGFTANRLAIRQSSVWVEYTAKEGDEVYDKGASSTKRLLSGVWTAPSTSIGVKQKKTLEKTVTIGSGDTTIWDFADISMALTNASNKLAFRLLSNPQGGDATLTLRIRKDSSGSDLKADTNVKNWGHFWYVDTPGDLNAHTYKLIGAAGSNLSWDFLLEIEEIAP